MIVPEPALRRAVPSDAPALALLGAATFLHAFAHDHPGAGLVHHVRTAHGEAFYRSALADPAIALWMMETPLGAPVGYAMLTEPAIDHPVRPGDLELKRIYMLSPWAGGGRGRRLVESVEAEARARGARRLLLCVYDANIAAQNFYSRLGYADTGLRQRFMVGDTPFSDQIWETALA